MLASWIFWTAAVCCAVAQIALFRSLVAARRAPIAPGTPRPARLAETMWVVIPALMLATALYFTWQAVRAKTSSERATLTARASWHTASLVPQHAAVPPLFD